MKVSDYHVLDRIHNHTRLRRMHLADWETVRSFEVTETCVNLIIDTFDVQVTRREDRYKKKGYRLIQIKAGPDGWHIAVDHTSWDDDFEPYVHVKYGTVRTADEEEEQREFEKMCYRPGSRRVQLDSYERVCDPIIRSTDRMERHF